MRVFGRGLPALFLGLAMLGLGCKDIGQAPGSLSYSANPATYVTGAPITPNSPTHSGGAVDSYSVSPALPGGLSLDATTGVISGTPSAATATASYTVTAANSGGSATASLSITVSDPALPPSITSQPANQSINAGLTAVFSVTATGTGTLSYQWQKDGVPIPGGTSASYTTPAAVLADSGSSFNVLVSDTYGNTVKSSSAILTVLAAGPGTSIATGSLAAARAFHTATLLSTGKVLIAGGYDASNTLQSAELYDPTGTFSPTGLLGTPRQSHTATLLADGTVLIIGGKNAGTALATAEVYYPGKGTFKATAGSLAAARFDHTATLLQNGKVLVVSGRSNPTTFVATAEIYDPVTGTFSATKQAPVAHRATHTATLLLTGKVLIAGGYSGGSLASAELYDPALDTFTAIANLSVARASHTATLLSNGKVLMVGGAATLVTELYDPTSGTFANTGNLTTARTTWHSATLLPSGKVLIAGGRGIGSPTAPILSSTELFDPSAGTFTLSGTLTNGRDLHTATALKDGKVLIAGGETIGYTATAEIYY